MMLQQPEAPQKGLAVPTYGVTIVMLIIGQMQVIAVIEIKTFNELLGTRYGLSLAQFFVSFLTIQLYGFFYRIIVSKPKWVRFLAGAWTYQINTISIMKPTKRAPYFCLLISAAITLLIMVISVTYGHIAINHKRDLAAQCDPVERTDIRADMLRDHRHRRDEAHHGGAALHDHLYVSVECVRDCLWRLRQEAALLSRRCPRRLHTDRAAVLSELLCPIHELCVDAGHDLGGV
ncbi:uncharacterized protein [Drosophila kikkawai]|uniref:Uncharacterized protein isoform X2 n=1 Tax=Drosophila kikkawai TaxID=30033 RepID=A0A6P4JJ25_DROKI|nr:uncharacterized protein LOC108083386 isoform X2 [Drosophila kikkawai]